MHQTGEIGHEKNEYFLQAPDILALARFSPKYLSKLPFNLWVRFAYYSPARWRLFLFGPTGGAAMNSKRIFPIFLCPPLSQMLHPLFSPFQETGKKMPLAGSGSGERQARQVHPKARHAAAAASVPHKGKYPSALDRGGWGSGGRGKLLLLGRARLYPALRIYRGGEGGNRNVFPLFCSLPWFSCQCLPSPLALPSFRSRPL